MTGRSRCETQDDCLNELTCVAGECVESDTTDVREPRDAGRDLSEADAAQPDVDTSQDTEVEDAAADPDATDPAVDAGNPNCPDLDGDGSSSERGCAGPADCDDQDPTVHPGAFEVCNGTDDDCDGRQDEGITLDADPNNCGSCGTVCRSPNAVSECSAGVCAFAGCYAGFRDRNNDTSDGCEFACATEESCGNAIDDDCDGLIDLADADCLVEGPLNGRRYWYSAWVVDLTTGSPVIETGIYTGTDTGGILSARTRGDIHHVSWGGMVPQRDVATSIQDNSSLLIGPSDIGTWNLRRPVGFGDSVLVGTGFTSSADGVFVLMIELRTQERRSPGDQALSWMVSPLSEGGIAHDARELAWPEPAQLGIWRFADRSDAEATLHWPFAEYRSAYVGGPDNDVSIAPSTYQLADDGALTVHQSFDSFSHTLRGALTADGSFGAFVRHIDECGPRAVAGGVCVPDPILGVTLRPDRTVTPSDISGRWRLVGFRTRVSSSGVGQDVEFIDVALSANNDNIAGVDVGGTISYYEEGSLNWFNSLRIDLTGPGATFGEMTLEGYLLEGRSLGVFWDHQSDPARRALDGGLLFLVRVGG